MKSNKMTKRILVMTLASVLMLAPGLSLRAAEQGDVSDAEAPTEIYTYEDLLRVAENPAGSYKLMNHIDMAGRPWQPVDFSGFFDGNGYALLNLEINSLGAGCEDTYDGNFKVYDTYFAGLFSTLKGAEVCNLSLVNIRVAVETDEPCFIGSIAGYSSDSVVRGCSIQGRLELLAHEQMFGLGGIIGYGSGLIDQSGADVTLICIDTDSTTRDEQFMGGAYAAGYIDLNGCSIRIDGYDSDHGYVHSGGLVGMYILYPRGLDYQGYITDNTVSGKITFFEDNTNRRAYCKAYVGEIMNWTFTNRGNQADFKRDEIFEYSVDLMPDMCADAVHTETVTEPGCDTFGYTTVQCEDCGYAYTDHYTLPRHTVEEWAVTTEPTVQDTGIRTGSCALCGAVLTETVAKLDSPPETPEPSSEASDSEITAAPGEAAMPDKSSETGGTEKSGVRSVMEALGNPAALIVGTVLVLIVAAAGIILFNRNRNR